MNEGDQIDRANDLADQEREARIAAVRAQAARGPVATGRCLYCDEIVADDVRWCSTECRDEWQHEAAARQRNGY